MSEATCCCCGLLFGATVVVAGITFAVVWIFKRFDGDLTLMWKERCGKQIDSLAGQVVWITGASSGIGEAMAYSLAHAPCRLVLSARRRHELERVKAACLAIGKVREEDILVVPLDMVQFGTHPAAVRQVLESFGKIDILVNNAGTSQRAQWLEVSLEVDRAIFDLNVLGPVSLTQHVLPHMKSRDKGQVVVMSSIAGKYGFPFSRSYSGSKYALHGYFDSLRTELCHTHIDVTVLCPGPVFSNVFLHSFTGKVDEKTGRAMDPSEKRLATARCAHLCCVAIANRMYEAWISLQPLLALLYLSQYAPDWGKWFLLKFGAKKLMESREGK